MMRRTAFDRPILRLTISPMQHTSLQVQMHVLITTFSGSNTYQIWSYLTFSNIYAYRITSIYDLSMWSWIGFFDDHNVLVEITIEAAALDLPLGQGSTTINPFWCMGSMCRGRIDHASKVNRHVDRNLAQHRQDRAICQERPGEEGGDTSDGLWFKPKLGNHALVKGPRSSKYSSLAPG